MSPRNHTVPLAESQHHVINPTNPGCALDDGVEHRLHVRRRAADDAEHLGRRCLMLQASRNSALRSWISLNSRTFSMAMTAWAAKVSSSSICLSVNGRTSVSANRNHSDRHSLSSSGVLSSVRMPRLLRMASLSGNSSSASSCKIINVNRLSFNYGSASNSATRDWRRSHRSAGNGP